jgi:uncharacterized membrane protein
VICECAEGKALPAGRRDPQLAAAAVAVVSFWQAAPRQNSIRELMEIELVDTACPLERTLIALTVFAIVTALARFSQLPLRFRGHKS